MICCWSPLAIWNVSMFAPEPGVTETLLFPMASSSDTRHDADASGHVEIDLYGLVPVGPVAHDERGPVVTCRGELRPEERVPGLAVRTGGDRRVRRNRHAITFLIVELGREPGDIDHCPVGVEKLIFQRRRFLADHEWLNQSDLTHVAPSR